MREYLFRGKRVDNNQWVEGYYVKAEKLDKSGYEHFIIEESMYGGSHLVVPESVGQYTGMNEFALTDKTRNAPLFEGDIVEVWGWRSVWGRNQSQYDKHVRVRGVIHFDGRGQWLIDYKNKYNEAIAKLRGSETDERMVEGANELYWYGYHGSDIEKYRAKELEWHGKFHNIEDIVGHNDVVKIGTVFENADLLGG